MVACARQPPQGPPVHLASSWGYDELQINRIYRLVREHRFTFLSAWNEFHGHQR